MCLSKCVSQYVCVPVCAKTVKKLLVINLGNLRWSRDKHLSTRCTRPCRQHAVLRGSCTPPSSSHIHCCMFDHRWRRPGCSRTNRGYYRHTRVVSSRPACTARLENTGIRDKDLHITRHGSITFMSITMKLQLHLILPITITMIITSNYC